MAYNFASASSQYLSLASTPVNNEPLTLAAWARATNITAHHTILALPAVSSQGGFRIYFAGAAAGDKLRAHLETSGGASNHSESIAAYSANTWHHCCGVFTNNSHRLVYLDGTAGTANTTARTAATSTQVQIGRWMNDLGAGMVGTDYLDGDIAEVGIWNVVLTAAEIAALAKGYSPLLIQPQSLVFYAPLIRELQNYKGGTSLTNNGTATVSNHPRVFNRQKRQSGLQGVNSYSIIADAGTYTLTGTAASLERGYLIAAAPGTYSLTGTDASLERGLLLSAGLGSYSITGTDAALSKGVRLAADSGTYALTGTAASLLVQRLLTAAAGTYSLTGTDAALSKSILLTADSGSYLITGDAANLLWAHRLVADSGVYTLTGASAQLRRAISLLADPGSYLLTGTDASLYRAITLLADAGVYTLTGTDANLIYVEAQGGDVQWWNIIKRRRTHRGF